jgi:protocatechuate 3,4-dioxygenase beta subunit
MTSTNTYALASCLRRAMASACFATAMLAARATFAQVLIEDDAPRPPINSTGAKSMPVTGRVVDEHGVPIGNAHVVIVASQFARSARPIGVSLRAYIGSHVLPVSFDVIGPVLTNDEGKFELDVPASRSGVYSGIDIFTAARGHACATRALGQTASREPVELALGPEHVVRGRLIDLKGQPAVGASVQVVEPGKPGWRPSRRALAIWEPVTTDDKGRFLIGGLSPERVVLQIEGDQFTPQHTYVKSVPIGSDEQTTLALAPAKRIHGRVTFADTGKPAANVRIISPELWGGVGVWVESRADSSGDFSINPFALENDPNIGKPKGYLLNVFPPTGERYLVSEITVPPSRAPNQQVDVKLERGILVRGRVTEAQSGMPVAGARVQHIALGSFAAEETGLQTAITAADGAFELPVPPKRPDPGFPIPDKPGHLLVLGPTLDYIKVETSQQELDLGRKPGMHRRFADAVVRLDFEPGTTEYPVDIKLRRGVRLKGKVLDPDNKPASEFVLFAGSYLAEGYQFSYSGPGTVLECHDGELELPGCDANKTHVVHLYDRKNGWGATAELSRKHESEPAIVRLQECGSAEARFVDEKGKPLAKFRPEYGCALTDGPPRPLYGNVMDDWALDATLFTKYVIDRKQDVPDPVTNDDGRIVFPNLIPGARHTIYWAPPGVPNPAPWPHMFFTVRAGERTDLGDTVVKGRVQQ